MLDLLKPISLSFIKRKKKDLSFLPSMSYYSSGIYIIPRVHRTHEAGRDLSRSSRAPAAGCPVGL